MVPKFRFLCSQIKTIYWLILGRNCLYVPDLISNRDLHLSFTLLESQCTGEYLPCKLQIGGRVFSDSLHCININICSRIFNEFAFELETPAAKIGGLVGLFNDQNCFY